MCDLIQNWPENANYTFTLQKSFSQHKSDNFYENVIK